MKVVIAPDSFKGSLPSARVARHIARGVRTVLAGAETVEVPLADGGEGTVEALVAATGGHFAETRVCDPLGRTILARYGFLGGGETAVIEMAAASGLPLLAASEQDPMEASTFGTGQLILDAARNGAGKIIIGIGGSATVDGGTGMARALGVRFLDSSGSELEGGGGILRRIARIDLSGLSAAVDAVTFTVACDVTNPLTGPNGAAAVYGPQKGAGPGEVEVLDEGLSALAACIRRDVGVDVERLAGAGAAGG
ncbi:MAG: glycerate kinase, partial [Planctomycetes bacterium]|nr:glycerate kinase [Planctomycetota bacterium]